MTSTNTPAEAPQRLVYLSTPCDTPTCGHAYNWHTAGGCSVKTCQCVAFAAGDGVQR